MKSRILVVDDDDFMRTSVCDALSDDGYDVQVFSEASSALEALQSSDFDMVITDLKMPKMNGLEFLERVVTADAHMPVLLMTAHGSVETAVDAMKHGALDYVQKPFSMDTLCRIVARGLEHRRLRGENEALKGELRRRVEDRPLIGKSPVWRLVHERIRAIANSDATVLVRGETGSGKELVSRAIHYASHRADRPYLCVNCAALSAGLLESELFGHEKGAFTGADRQRSGRFELADGGTLLLDEVSEIDANLQAKLLRVLQEKSFERVGSGKTRSVDVRVIATTNRNLEEEVNEGRFRADLYYRLNIVPIEVPPLRNRKEDLPELIDHFKQRSERRAGRTARKIEDESYARMLAYHWPGNVRELENMIERAVLLSTGDEIEVEELGGERAPQSSNPDIESFRGMALADVERAVIADTLRQYDGHQKKTALSLGIGVRTLRDKIKKWDLYIGRRARARAEKSAGSGGSRPVRIAR